MAPSGAKPMPVSQSPLMFCVGIMVTEVFPLGAAHDGAVNQAFAMETDFPEVQSVPVVPTAVDG